MGYSDPPNRVFFALKTDGAANLIRRSLTLNAFPVFKVSKPPTTARVGPIYDYRVDTLLGF